MFIHPNKQIRLRQYDYTQPGYYFVTICTKNKTELFGTIEKCKMLLNETGKIAERLWKQIPETCKVVSLDEFIVMPNHLHGIVVINPDRKGGTPRRAATGLHALTPNSLPSIVNHYKGAVKKECNKNGFTDFLWQSRFYDHVIRKDESLDKIREYIRNNPLKWELDRNNPSSLYM